MPLTEENQLEYRHNNEPKCPHCDRRLNIAEHELYFLYGNDDDVHEIVCPFCDKEMLVVPYAEWTFSTSEQDDD